MSTVPVSTPFNVSLDFAVAPLGRRILASLIDLCIMVIYSSLLYYLIFTAFNLTDSRGTFAIVLQVTAMLPLFFYHVIFEVAMQGQSPGKHAMGLRVISLKGGEPDLGQYIIRWILRVWEWPLVFNFVSDSNEAMLLGLLVCFLGITVLVIIAVNKRQQRLGDLAAGTAVVLAKQVVPFSDTIFQEVKDQNYEVMFPQVMKLSDRDVNAVKTVLAQARRGDKDTAYRVMGRIKEVLDISSNLEVTDFLDRLILDYNYLATREK